MPANLAGLQLTIARKREGGENWKKRILSDDRISANGAAIARRSLRNKTMKRDGSRKVSAHRWDRWDYHRIIFLLQLWNKFLIAQIERN